MTPNKPDPINEHRPFIRISWKEGLDVMEKALQDKYGANGKIMLVKSYGYDGVGEFYDSPTFIDIYLRES